MEKIYIQPIHIGSYKLRLITKEDFEAYYKSGFEVFDEEVAYLTASSDDYKKQDIYDYVNRIVDDSTRYDFLIINEHDDIIGESVINEIDWNARNAGFRICIFKTENCSKGLGKQVVYETMKVAFEFLNLHRIELEVFSYNKRAQHVYKQIGFHEEGVRKDALFIKGEYHDIHMMGLLENDWIR